VFLSRVATLTQPEDTYRHTFEVTIDRYHNKSEINQANLLLSQGKLSEAKYFLEVAFVGSILTPEI